MVKKMGRIHSSHAHSSHESLARWLCWCVGAPNIWLYMLAQMTPFWALVHTYLSSGRPVPHASPSNDDGTGGGGLRVRVNMCSLYRGEEEVQAWFIISRHDVRCRNHYPFALPDAELSSMETNAFCSLSERSFTLSVTLYLPGSL